MHGPAVVSWLLAPLCAASGVYRLALGGRGEAADRVTARIEAGMGLSMAAMALPDGGAALPAGAFVVLFAALAGWSAWSAWRPGRVAARHRGHGLHHTLEALAMAYMGTVMLGAGGGDAHSGHHGVAGGIPALTGGLLVYFAAFALYTGARLLPAAATGDADGGTARAVRPPVMADVCRLTLALGSFTMLLTLSG